METNIEPKPDEREHAEFNRVAERLSTVAEVLGFEEPDVASAAHEDLVTRVNVDSSFDEANAEHRALLDAYQRSSEASLEAYMEQEPAIGYQLALMRLWLELDDPDRFYERLEAQGKCSISPALTRPLLKSTLSWMTLNHSTSNKRITYI